MKMRTVARTDFTAADIARFWSKVDSSAGPDACWPYLGGTDKDGYGKFQIEEAGGQRALRAHRVALALTLGAITESGLHSCDNPPCCNPRHLSQGTQATNCADKVRRGRAASGDRNGARVHPETRARGESHPRGLLTLELVLEIRRRYAAGEGISAIARALGLPRQPVKSVVHGHTWRHV